MTNSIQPVSLKTTCNTSDLELKEPHGSLVLRVVEIYRKSTYYNLIKLVPELFLAVQHMEPTVIEQAIKGYEVSKDKRTGKVPHPRYFVGIAKRMHDESIRVDETKKESQREKPGQTGDGLLLWGRSI